MKQNIIFYPTLDKTLVDKMAFKMLEFAARYSDNKGSYELSLKEDNDGISNVINIVDETGKWSLDQHNLEISGTIVIKNTAVLFGNEGLVGEDATLGVSLVWKSRPSNIRGAECIGKLNKSTGEVVIDFSKAFEASILRGYVNLTVELFVIDAGGKDNRLKTGLTLGAMYDALVMLEGTGSNFAVFEKSAPGEPLWTVDCDWDDPEYSQFSECVKVTINTAHPAWTLASEDDVRKELLKEIMASSMQIVIAEVGHDQLATGDDYEPGSVCDAVSYFVNRAGLNMESNATIAKSIRAYLDKSMK